MQGMSAALGPIGGSHGDCDESWLRHGLGQPDSIQHPQMASRCWLWSCWSWFRILVRCLLIRHQLLRMLAGVLCLTAGATGAAEGLQHQHVWLALSTNNPRLLAPLKSLCRFKHLTADDLSLSRKHGMQRHKHTPSRRHILACSPVIWWPGVPAGHTGTVGCLLRRLPPQEPHEAVQRSCPRSCPPPWPGNLALACTGLGVRGCGWEHKLRLKGGVRNRSGGKACLTAAFTLLEMVRVANNDKPHTVYWHLEKAAASMDCSRSQSPRSSGWRQNPPSLTANAHCPCQVGDACCARMRFTPSQTQPKSILRRLLHCRGNADETAAAVMAWSWPHACSCVLECVSMMRLIFGTPAGRTEAGVASAQLHPYTEAACPTCQTVQRPLPGVSACIAWVQPLTRMKQ